MAIYYVNKNAQANGEHKVHRSDCDYLPNQKNRRYLGEFSNCAGAVQEAKKTYPTTDGCAYCSAECNTS